MSGFTEQQNAALERAWDILTEHFHGVALSVLTECGEIEPQEAVRSYYHGGRIQSLGLIENMKHCILNKPADESLP